MARIPIEEHQAGGEQGANVNPGFRRRGPQECGRLLDQETAAIAGLAVRGNCAAMGQTIERADGRLEHPVAGLIVETRDQAESAGVLFIGRPVKAPIPHTRILAVEAGAESAMSSIRHILRPYSSLPCSDPQSLLKTTT